MWIEIDQRESELWIETMLQLQQQLLNSTQLQLI